MRIVGHCFNSSDQRLDAFGDDRRRTSFFELSTELFELRLERRAVVLGHCVQSLDELERRLGVFERLVDDDVCRVTVELQRYGHAYNDLCISEADVLSDDVLDTLCLVLGDCVLGEGDDGLEHGELLTGWELVEEDGTDDTDVNDRAADDAQREDECGHGAALLITWRYAWRRCGS